jgi:hypothetical protein
MMPITISAAPRGNHSHHKLSIRSRRRRRASPSDRLAISQYADWRLVLRSSLRATSRGIVVLAGVVTATDYVDNQTDLGRAVVFPGSCRLWTRHDLNQSPSRLRR